MFCDISHCPRRDVNHTYLDPVARQNFFHFCVIKDVIISTLCAWLCKGSEVTVDNHEVLVGFVAGLKDISVVQSAQTSSVHNFCTKFSIFISSHTCAWFSD